MRSSKGPSYAENYNFTHSIIPLAVRAYKYYHTQNFGSVMHLLKPEFIFVPISVRSREKKNKQKECP